MSDNMQAKMSKRTFGNVARRVVRIKRQSRYGRPIQAVWKVFSEYSETSTVHGVRYLGERRRHWLERIWWILTVSVSVFLCFGFIFQAWWKWTTSPVIITFADEATPISSIPFPTITICNDMMVNISVLNYTTIRTKLSWENYTKIDFDIETIRKMHSLANFCNFKPEYLGNYTEFKDFAIDRNIMPYLEKVAPNLTGAFSAGRCNLASVQDIECGTIFTRTLTDTGLCYTFNQMNSSDIYNVDLLADDFPKVNGFHFSYNYLNLNGTQELRSLSHPYHIENSGRGLELRIKLPKAKNESDYMCSEVLAGFRIQIHSGEEVPLLKKHFYHIPFDHDVRIVVHPNLMKTTSSLIENYTQKQRKCIAANEHNLQFFKKYNQLNCQLDMLALKMNKNCGCVLFWMPRCNETKVCRFGHEFKCIERVENLIHSKNLTTKCLPVCDSISYDAEISTSKIELKSLRMFVPDGYRVIKISVLFKDQQYFGALRTELYGTMDFIAQCGGILSLFMGISILSFIEIIYFATLRLSCKLHKRNLARKRILAQQNMIHHQNQ